MEITTSAPTQNNGNTRNNDFMSLEIRVPKSGKDAQGNDIDLLFGYLNMPKRLFADPNDISKIQKKFAAVDLVVDFRKESVEQPTLF